MNAQNAIEAPRFGTRHLVSSFDNHAWDRGDLLLDERIPHPRWQPTWQSAATTSARFALFQRGRAGADQSAGSGGIEAGQIRTTTDRLMPVGDAPAFRSGSGVRPSRSGADASDSLASQNIWIGTSSWKYDGWLDQIYSRERYVTRGRFSKKRFEAECLCGIRRNISRSVCGDFSFYQFPTAGVLAAPVYDGSRGAALRLESARRSHGRGISQARALRSASRDEERVFSELRCTSRRVSRAARALSRPHRNAYLRVWCTVHAAARIRRPVGTVSERPAAIVPLFRRSTQSKLL